MKTPSRKSTPLTERGIAILLITSELPELLAMSDRIVVLHRGRLTAEFTREEATSEKVMEAAMGKREEKSLVSGDYVASLGAAAPSIASNAAGAARQ